MFPVNVLSVKCSQVFLLLDQTKNVFVVFLHKSVFHTYYVNLYVEVYNPNYIVLFMFVWSLVKIHKKA